MVERYTSQGASGAWIIYRWHLACSSIVVGDIEDRNGDSGQWHNEWLLNGWVESLILQWLRETFLPFLVKEPAEYPEPDQVNASRETLLPEERNGNEPPSAPPPQEAAQFCPHSGQVRHLKRWLTKFFADQVDIFHIYAKMGNHERTPMQLKFQDSPNPTEFITAPKVGGTGLNLTAANHAVITQKFWVLHEQQHTIAQVVWLGQNGVPHT